MADARSRVIVCASKADASIALAVAEALREKGNLVWSSEWELESISDLSDKLKSWKADVTHFIALFTDNSKNHENWNKIGSLPSSVTSVLVLLSADNSHNFPKRRVGENQLEILVKETEEIEPAILKRCPDLGINPKDSEQWYKHIEAVYKVVSDYDRHYSSVRSALTTFLLTFSYYIASLFLKEAKTPEALLFSLVVPMIFLIIACVLSSHFQSLTAACENIEKRLDGELTVVTSPMKVGTVHYSFRSLLDEEHEKTASFYPDVPNMALWVVTAAFGFGTWLATQGMLCASNISNVQCDCISLSNSKDTWVPKFVFNVLPLLPIVFGIVVSAGIVFQLHKFKRAELKKLGASIKASIGQFLPKKPSGQS